MKSIEGKVLVRVDMEQKDSMIIGNIEFKMANKYEVNHRIKSPVIGVIQETNRYLRKGDIAIFHHNHFYGNSPYLVEDNLFSVPMNKTVFCLIKEGDLFPVFRNVLCEKIQVKTLLPLPPEQVKFHHNQFVVTDGGWTKFKKGDVIHTFPNSGYDIIYIYNKIDTKITKVDSEMICGLVR